jgi:hypothetical protein
MFDTNTDLIGSDIRLLRMYKRPCATSVRLIATRLNAASSLRVNGTCSRKPSSRRASGSVAATAARNAERSSSFIGVRSIQVLSGVGALWPERRAVSLVIRRQFHVHSSIHRDIRVWTPVNAPAFSKNLSRHCSGGSRVADKGWVTRFSFSGAREDLAS